MASWKGYPPFRVIHFENLRSLEPENKSFCGPAAVFRVGSASRNALLAATPNDSQYNLGILFRQDGRQFSDRAFSTSCWIDGQVIDFKSRFHDPHLLERPDR